MDTGADSSAPIHPRASVHPGGALASTARHLQAAALHMEAGEAEKADPVTSLLQSQTLSSLGRGQAGSLWPRWSAAPGALCRESSPSGLPPSPRFPGPRSFPSHPLSLSLGLEVTFPQDAVGAPTRI